MKYLKLNALLLIFVLLGCQKEKAEVFNKEETITEIKSMFDNYHEAIKQNGLPAEFDYLDDSDDFFWVPPGYKSVIKYDSIKSILIQNNKSIQSISFEFETLEIFPLSPEIANYSGIVKGKMIDTANATSNFKIIESGTLIKRTDGWKLLNGQSRNLD
ncbi:hypothetical protein C1T31_05500 [Hanstruepera neustonica]|uniref:Uncharacterized protein n=1 Tax=Hanstruepera neustonica TaxID=1445657 RepID=A0A2K1E0I6_9FLAO|nr:nuclear transport factor 2 family protein [Hanstruepera neustonica]PNQ73789.1 hypothetical protein C1T31_05500 [Hanstruepera neustonica]